MVHNPRRSESARPTEPDPLDDAMIDQAMQRAHALRCHGRLDPDRVEVQPLSAYRALEMTERYRLHSWGYRMHRNSTDPPDPWWHVGWISVGEEWLHNTWAVWLNLEDQRVHLRLEWHGRPEADDPYR